LCRWAHDLRNETMSTHGICRTLRTRWARPTPGLAEPRPLCAVCVRGCARVRQGWLGSFMQFGYRIISDMSHISLLLFKRGQSSGLRCDCSRLTQQAKTNAKLAVQGLGVIATVPWSVLFLQGGMKEILESPTRIVLRNSSAPGQPGALLCAVPISIFRVFAPTAASSGNGEQMLVVVPC
jgi:hypothetical protein